MLQPPEGQSPLSELFLHVRPRGVHPVQEPPGVPIHDVVEYLGPRVAHSNFVRVGIAEEETHLGGFPVLPRQTDLVAHVAVGLGDERKDFRIE